MRIAPLSDEDVQEAVTMWRAFHHNVSAAATHLGIPRKTFDDRLAVAERRGLLDRALERYQAQQGRQPEFGIRNPLPDGLTLARSSVNRGPNGEIQQDWTIARPQGRDPEEVVQLPGPKTISKVSTLYDQQGRVSQQWVAEKPSDVAKEKAWEQFAEALNKTLSPYEPVAFSGKIDKRLAIVIPVGDFHVGMLSWAPETGANFDIAIAKRLMAKAMEHLVNAAPPCQVAVLAILGDFAHYDGISAVTPTSKNLVDADGRFAKMIDACIEILRRSISIALSRHATVHVIVEIGNHDLSVAIVLSRMLAIVYENEPRVTIDTSPSHYHYWRWGNNLVGTHHGHGAKLADLPLIMANDRADDWGQTRHRYIHTGHVHHDNIKDIGGVMVETHGILPPSDAFSAGKGYRSKRLMKYIILDFENGEVARNIVTPAMCHLEGGAA